jgi:type VI secretion system secreted protein VgrG
MASYTQAGWPMSLTTPLGQDALLLEELHGTEAVSELFHFRLDLLTPEGKRVLFAKVLGRKVTVALTMPDGGYRYINGLVNRVTKGAQVRGPQGKPTFFRYRAELVPEFWLWTKRVRSRIFQQKSVPDILKEVLAGLDVDFRLQGQYPKRDYCVQYQESDFAFACRLMEDEGITYFFSHTANGHTLVLTDSTQGHPHVPEPSQLHFEEVAGEVRPDDRILSWEKTQELRAGKYTAWDYCFEMADKNLGATAKTPLTVRAGTITHALDLGGSGRLELFDYPGGYAHHVDGVGPSGNDQSDQLAKLFSDNARTARLRMEEETSGAVSVAGESSCRQLTAGHRFALDRHDTADGPYLLTRVEHAASLRGAYTTEPRRAFDYRNSFEAVPAGLPYRPARATPRPCIVGPQTAVVVGPSGEDVFTDKYGRIKVQFFWDRQAKDQGTNRKGSAIIPLQYWGAGDGAANPTSSCWVRVAQNWAGRGWGGMVIPRIGQEVVIGFQDGDPDRPLCLGCLYNSANLPPLPLPDRAMDMALKTHSVGGTSDNFSGLAIHDGLGEEHLQLHSERDMTIMAEQHHVVNVGVQHHVNVGKTHITTVGALPGGSGGGGGEGDGGETGGGGEAGGGGEKKPEEDGPVKYEGLFQWKMGGVAAELGQNLKLVYGEETGAVVGLAGAFVFGCDTKFVLNPSAFLGVVPVPALNFISSILSGESKFVIGSETTIVYGQNVDLDRGPVFKMNTQCSLLTNVLANVLAALSTATVLTAGALDPSGKTGTIADYSLLGASGLALAAVAGSEVYAVVKDVTEVVSEWAESAALTLDIAQLKANVGTVVAGTDLAGTAATLRTDLTTLQGTVAPIQNHVNINGGAYVLTGDTITETSDLSTLLVSGTGPLVASQCRITLDPAAPPGGRGIFLEYGSNPALPINAQLNAQGVTLTAGPPAAGAKVALATVGPPPGLTLSFGPECTISLNATGITLSYGLPGAGYSITLNAAGITLTVGTTVLALTPEAFNLEVVTFNVGAEGQFTVAAQALTETVTGIAARTAASTTIM